MKNSKFNIYLVNTSIFHSCMLLIFVTDTVTPYAFSAVHALNKLPYSKLDSKTFGITDGVVFVTYSSLIASSENRSRLQQLVQWCGSEFDGLLVFDEVNKTRLNCESPTKGIISIKCIWHLLENIHLFMQA